MRFFFSIHKLAAPGFVLEPHSICPAVINKGVIRCFQSLHQTRYNFCAFLLTENRLQHAGEPVAGCCDVCHVNHEFSVLDDAECVVHERMNHTRLEIALKFRLRLAAQIIVLWQAEPAPTSWNHHPHFRTIKHITLQGGDQLVRRKPIHFVSDDIENSVLQVGHCQYT